MATAWTGTDSTGRRDGCGICSEWTSGDAGADWTCQGLAYLTTEGWSDGTGVTGCDYHGSIFCFGVDLSAPVTLPKVAGRYAFLTKTAWNPATGIASADALCNTEARAGALPGNYLAFLATTTMPAASRFDLDGGNWIRPPPDGLPIAASPLALSIGTIETTITVASDGTYLIGDVWTGAAHPSGTPNTPGNSQSTCADWSDAGAVGERGIANHVTTEFFESEYNEPCTDAHPIYCLQE